MRLFTIIVLILASAGMQAQEKTISVRFDKAPLERVFNEIEQQSGYRFFFDRQWFAAADSVSASFSALPVTQVLDAVLAPTDLNYFVDGTNIILTRNSIVYGELPDGYFGEKSAKTAATPVYYQENGLADRPSRLVLIGRENKEHPARSAVISGRITDSRTKAPLPGILVQLAGTETQSITDEDGRYRMTVPAGRQQLEIRSINYLGTARKLMVYDDGSLDFRLRENPNMLEEVTVTANAASKVKSSETGVTKIDVESIKNIPLVLGERDIFKVATTLPGIKTTGEGSSGYNVRGGKEDQNLILLDDAVLYNAQHFLGFFSAVNPYTTGSATIYKGSIPAEYGGRLSSVFDIRSKDAGVEKISGEGGIGPVTSNLAVNVPVIKGKAGLLAGGRATYSGWILRSLDSDDLRDSKASFYDGILKYNHRFGERDAVDAMAYYSKDEFSITSDSIYGYSNFLLALHWNHKFNDRSRGSLSVTNSHYRFGIDYESGDANAFRLDYSINETQLQLKMRYSLGDRHKLQYGLAGKTYRIEPGNIAALGTSSLVTPFSVATERALESGIYLSDDYEPSRKLLISLGLRYSWYAALGASTQRTYQPGLPLNDGTVTGEKTYASNEIIKTYGGFEPRISARYLLTDDLSVKAGFDQTYQYIHLLSSNTTQSPTDTWKLSDLNVEPQRSRQVSLGLFKDLKNTYELSVEGYYKRSSNILDYKVGAQLLLNEYVETQLLQGEGKSYGMEFLVKKNLGRLNGWLSYTYSRTFIKLDSPFSDERVNNGEWFPANFDKPHDFSAVLNYKFTRRYSASANFIYQTGRPITYPVGSYVYNGIEYTTYSDRNEFRIPDYYRLDLGINIEGNHKIKKLAHSFWNISVYNVLGRNNPYSVFFVTENGEVKAYKTSIFAVPVPTVTYNFKF